MNRIPYICKLIFTTKATVTVSPHISIITVISQNLHKYNFDDAGKSRHQ